MRRRPGIFIADALTGMAIFSAMTIALAVAISQQQRGAAMLAESRHLVRQAEQVLLNLQAGGSVLRLKDAEVRIEHLPDAPKVAGQRWVKVQVRDGNRSAELIGLAPGGER